MVSVALTGGRLEVSGCLRLAWRTNFLSASSRHELLLPRDVGNTMQFALPSINKPKTRQTGPRHQAAKLDVDIAFGDLPEPAKQLSYGHKQGKLSDFVFERFCVSLRRWLTQVGGYTWHLQVTEDGELCRRKGRWLSQRVMEI